MDITTTTVTECWRVRLRKPGERKPHYYPTRTFATKEDALSWIDANKIYFPKSRLGVVWHRTEVTETPVEWVHN